MTAAERQAEYDYRRRECLGRMAEDRPATPEQETLAANEARAGVAELLEHEANEMKPTTTKQPELL